MSLHGYGRRTTPSLERITDDGFRVYNRCFSPASWTIPSHVSFFTGLYPDEHGVGGHDLCMPGGIYCLAEILQYLGYATFGVTSNALVSGLLNFHRGFDGFYEMWRYCNSIDFFEINQVFSDSKKEVRGEWGRFLLLLKLSHSHRDYTFLLKKFIDSIYQRQYGISAIRRRSARSTLRTIDTAKSIIKTRDDQKPFFLFLNIMETHYQYNPPPRIDAFGEISSQERQNILKKYEWHHYAREPFSDDTFETIAVLYDREIVFLDSILSDFYSFLKNNNLLDNTILIITSDHGDLLGEHGQYLHVFTLYNELLHVPLLIRFPREVALKGRTDALVQLHDIFATVMDVAGSVLPTPDSSHSLLSSDRRKVAYSQLISCERQISKYRGKNPSFVVQDFMQPYTSLITDRMMKITKRADNNIEMYDLNRDLYETEDLSNKPEFAAEKSNLLQSLAKPR
jgi:arylsulfatase A-like enzyme